MLSPAQRNQLRKRAALESAAASPAMSMEGATAYEQQLAALAQDRLRLKNVQSEQGKAQLKQQLIPSYLPYIEGVLEAGQGAQDDVLTTLMVWCIDAEDFALALKIGAYVLQHGLKMPDRFARTTATLLAEEVANGALKRLKAGEQFTPTVLQAAMDLTEAHDMPDQVRAKLRLAIGKGMLAQAESIDPESAELQIKALEYARDNLSAAISLHDSCGGKKDLEKVGSLLKKHAKQSEPTEPAADGKQG